MSSNQLVASAHNAVYAAAKTALASSEMYAALLVGKAEENESLSSENKKLSADRDGYKRSAEALQARIEDLEKENASLRIRLGVYEERSQHGANGPPVERIAAEAE